MSNVNIPELVKKQIDEAIAIRGKINILIAGRTGVGKSTLVNEVFQGNLTTTGQGRPVTKTTREISKKGIPLRIWDTRGLEMKDFKETIKNLEDLIKVRSEDEDPQKHIHIAWLCIHEDGRRVEEAEIELHKMLAKHMPVIAVITKARADNGFRLTVQSLLPQARNVVRVRAIPEEFDGGTVLKPMGLEDLVELTVELIPEAQHVAFVASQKVSIKNKKTAGHKIVAVAVLSASAVAASPIPFSDAFALIPIQVGMLAKISSAFGLELTSAFLGTLVSTMVGSSAATIAGRTIVSNIFKLFPGIGSIAGGTISATTAAALTTALGEMYIATLASVFEKSKGEVPTNQEISDEFKRRLGGNEK